MKNFIFKKSLGQNFLNDNNVIKKIVQSANILDNSLIIEIGPGNGALTKELLTTNANVLCFEIDERLKESLEKIKSEKLLVVFEDFLKADLNKYLQDYTYKNLYIIANLPYYITTAIINKIIDSNINPNEMILMVQKEVGNRFAAVPKTKEYGSLSVFLQYHFNISKLMVVNKNSFTPKPKIDSVVMRFLKIENKYKVDNLDIFYKLVKDSFKQKRKIIKNNLYKYDLKIIEKILCQNGFSLNSRAEEINIKTFVEISNKIV